MVSAITRLKPRVSLDKSSLAFTSCPILYIPTKTIVVQSGRVFSSYSETRKNTYLHLCWFHVDIKNITRVNCSRSPWQLALQQNGESSNQKVLSACEISPALRQPPSQTFKRLQNWNEQTIKQPGTSFLYHVKEPNWNTIVTDLSLVYKQYHFSTIVQFDILMKQTSKKYVTQISSSLKLSELYKIEGYFCSKQWEII